MYCVSQMSDKLGFCGGLQAVNPYPCRPSKAPPGPSPSNQPMAATAMALEAHGWPNMLLLDSPLMPPTAIRRNSASMSLACRK